MSEWIEKRKREKREKRGNGEGEQTFEVKASVRCSEVA